VLKNAEDLCQDLYSRSLDEVIAELDRVNDDTALINFLQSFIDKLFHKGFKDTQMQGYLGYLRQYTKSRGVKVSDDIRDEISIPTSEIEPRVGVEKQQIKELLSLIRDPKYYTLVLFLVSSACRVQEAMHIRVEDIDFLDSGIAQINLKASYVKEKKLSRTTFVSRECVSFLLCCG